MFVIFGTYHWAPKLVAFRRDWCTMCKIETVVIGRRTIDFGHLFWIPILPLGVWTRWYCSNCTMDPAQSAETRRPLRIIAWLLVCVSLLALAVEMVRSDPGIQDGSTLLVLLLAVLGIGYMTWWAFRSFGGLGYKERREAVQPFSGSHCPLCKGDLMQSLPDQKCAACDAEHRPINSASGISSVG